MVLLHTLQTFKNFFAIRVFRHAPKSLRKCPKKMELGRHLGGAQQSRCDQSNRLEMVRVGYCSLSLSCQEIKSVLRFTERGDITAAIAATRDGTE